MRLKPIAPVNASTRIDPMAETYCNGSNIPGASDLKIGGI